MPQARHGGKGVCTFAAEGSKLDGTGFEKLQMVHTHVAELATGVSGFGRGEPSGRGECGSWLRRDALVLETVCRRDALFGGLGTMVTLGEDFQKPA